MKKPAENRAKIAGTVVIRMQEPEKSTINLENAREKWPFFQKTSKKWLKTVLFEAAIRGRPARAFAQDGSPSLLVARQNDWQLFANVCKMNRALDLLHKDSKHLVGS